MIHRSDDLARIRKTRNTARFFTETRQLSWVLLLGSLAWGLAAYHAMPQRKDPDIPVRVALALAPWPGANAERIEELVTRRIEERIAENPHVQTLTSNTRTGIAVVQIELTEDVPDPGQEFDDLRLKLDAIRDLPDGAGPIQFVKDFGDTAALLLTVASPRADAVEVRLRAESLAKALAAARVGRGCDAGERAAIVAEYPKGIDPRSLNRALDLFHDFAVETGAFLRATNVAGPGFIALDGCTPADDATLVATASRFVTQRLHAVEFHPDAWPPAVVRDATDLPEVERRIAAIAGPKYSYRELEEATDLLRRTFLTVPEVAKVTRSGLLDETVFLDYSQERVAGLSLQPSALPGLLASRNLVRPGGVFEAEARKLRVAPSGEWRSERAIGDVLVPSTGGAPPLHLRDLFDIQRSYESPPRYLNYYLSPDADGIWQRRRAVTMSVQMRSGEQIARFGESVDAALVSLAGRIPSDLILARTSDQPRQVRENVGLFMNSLYEAIFLVVLVSLIGFWEWRSALLMALSIPLTLALTFGMMQMLGIDLQQVSIASLILALGLLVDDPVVAGDAIKRELGAGHDRAVAAWWGPTKLATAILFATITNIVAYLPMLLLSGDQRRFLYTLPVVITCSLVASRLVSMSFIPFLGYYLLRPRAEPTGAERRQSGFALRYDRIAKSAIAHRWRVLGLATLVLVASGLLLSKLKPQYFPKDLSYLSYVDVWLPDDAPIGATLRATEAAERVIVEVAEAYGREHAEQGTLPRSALRSLTSFVGGGGPRFWFSVSPELQQPNYAQIVLEAWDKHETRFLIGPLQRALDERVPGARIDVRQLESGPPVGVPVSFRISGEEIATLRRLADRAKAILAAVPNARRARDDWGEPSFVVRLAVDADRAAMAGLSSLDVAASSAAALNGSPVASLRDGDRLIPVVSRLRMEERSRVSDLGNLYVFSGQGTQRVPLASVSRMGYSLETERIRRRNHFRTISVSAFPADGVLPSELLQSALPKLRDFQASLPPGYLFEIGGEHEKQTSGFGELRIVMAASILLIYLALVVQFRHALKPLVVFAAIPFGVAGAIFALWLTATPFGFMAFLGIASLVGVIVSHVIVLFDFIEERRREGETLERALVDAGILRLRPVLITVAATVVALFPLAGHGGPLWEPLCYAQIGGLTVATFVTLLLVPVLYAIFVLDLKLMRWQSDCEVGTEPDPIPAAVPTSPT